MSVPDHQLDPPEDSICPDCHPDLTDEQLAVYEDSGRLRTCLAHRRQHRAEENE